LFDKHHISTTPIAHEKFQGLTLSELNPASVVFRSHIAEMDIDGRVHSEFRRFKLDWLNRSSFNPVWRMVVRQTPYPTFAVESPRRLIVDSFTSTIVSRLRWIIPDRMGYCCEARLPLRTVHEELLGTTLNELNRIGAPLVGDPRRLPTDGRTSRPPLQPKSRSAVIHLT
jgi:hypothetical protein